MLNSAFELFFACFGAIEGAVGNEVYPAHFADVVQASNTGWQYQRCDALNGGAGLRVNQLSQRFQRLFMAAGQRVAGV